MFRPALSRLIVAAFALASLAQAPRAETTPPQPAAAQPDLPDAAAASPPKPGSPVVEDIVKQKQPPLTVRGGTSEPRPRNMRAARRHGRAHGPRLAHRRGPPRDLDRPALAGVALVAPLPPPTEPPHIVVPTPAYPLDALAAAYLTPPPPIVCHPVRRDPRLPDPRLYKETPVECAPDNP